MQRLGLAGLVLLGSMVLATSAASQNENFQFTTVQFPSSTFTLAYGINADGDIVGLYLDTGGNQHGFLLSGGKYTSIDFPGAIATDARGIGPGGDIVGSYTNAPGGPANVHGYLLSQGTFTEIQFPGYLGTIAQRIGPDGAIYGCAHNTNVSGSMHGFVRTAAGNFEDISVPASMHNGATPDGNTIVGLYTDLTKQLGHGYVMRNGHFAAFDAPGSIFTAAWDINPSGTIVGSFADTHGKFHGFLRDAAGNFTSIDFPAAIATRAFGINPNGDVVGNYMDSSGYTHGYLWSIPK